jgi:hypothetical protein
VSELLGDKVDRAAFSGVVGRRLVDAAAAAAVLAFDGAGLAEVRTRAFEVRAWGGTLLTVTDAERRALAERREQGPLARQRLARRLGRRELKRAHSAHTSFARRAYIRRLPPNLY